MSDPPRIAPVAPGARPFWSVMIPTYEPNPEFLSQTLAAVLGQDPAGVMMEIVLVDDCSQGIDARTCVPSAARDRVGWFRHPARVGIGGNWNACIERARGEWVHILHQDDVVRDGFYRRLSEGIAQCPAAGAAFCRDVVIDARGDTFTRQVCIRTSPGVVEDWIEHIFIALHLRAPALVVKRSVYEQLGGFRLDLPYALDWDMWKRIAASYPLWYEPEELACYRRHHGSATFGFVRSGANIDEIGRSIEMSAASLPPAIAPSVTQRARDHYTRYAVEMARRALHEGDLRSCVAQLRAARRLSSSFQVARELVRSLRK